MQEFLEIAVIGSALALVIQLIKTKFGLDSVKTKILTLSLSVLLGASYYFLSQTAIWQTILGILASASTVWAFLLRDKQ